MKVIYAILILFLATSCAKDGGGFLGLGEGGETTVKGKVTEKGSGKAVAGAQVMLKSQPEGSWMAIFSVDTVVYTNNKGEYSLSFIADKDRVYEVQPQQELYKNTQSSKSISAGKKNKTDLEMEPWAWVRVHIINEPPLDSLAYVSYNNFENPPNFVNGFHRDTIIVGKLLGNKNLTIIEFWRYNRLNAPEHSHKIDFNVPAHDTVDYTFKY